MGAFEETSITSDGWLIFAAFFVPFRETEIRAPWRVVGPGGVDLIVRVLVVREPQVQASPARSSQHVQSPSAGGRGL